MATDVLGGPCHVQPPRSYLRRPKGSLCETTIGEKPPAGVDFDMQLEGVLGELNSQWFGN